MIVSKQLRPDLNRKARRALAARKRCLIQKHTPFGRVRVIDIESGDLPQDDRIVYRHFTKGLVDRRTTTALLDNLIGRAA
jgi:hypothetical protein